MPKPTAANLAAFALLALHCSSLITIPPLAVNVVVTATAIVYLGCRKGLKLLPGARAKAAKGKSSAPQETVTLSATEAWQFPLYGSLALCGMYALIKVLGKKRVPASFGALRLPSARATLIYAVDATITYRSRAGC